jgi:disulfide bond formation protein DsbB
MTRPLLILIAAGGSFALLAGAFVFQAIGYAPCEMCLWQRWPHAAAILIGAIVILGGFTGRVWAYLGALAAAATGILGIYHTGVERDWWEGPTSCTGGGDLGTGADLLSMDGPALVMCDQVAIWIFGLSMASWNAIFSVGFVVIWIMAARRKA